MEFKYISSEFHPAYTWLWNTAITREGIRQQLQEMYDAGIRAFYVIGEPKNFRPNRRNTHLSPEYLSEEYLDLLYYAWETGKKLGMTMWLYNEGGFPSGMVCGQIRKEHPELAMLELTPVALTVPNGTPYEPSEKTVAAFSGTFRVYPGHYFQEDTQITEYRLCPESVSGIRTDNGTLRNTELFLQLTHEKLLGRFGNAMGNDITLMFDDEAYMGSWTDGFDEIFYNRTGYSCLDYLPWITGQLTPETQEQLQARSDYFMVCGDLVRENYFTPMKEWLRRHGMRSTGHLDRDHTPDNCVDNRYGNTMQTLREFDIPGVDVIWEQITYPVNGSACPEGMPFFPRMASSAARQLGHSTAVSESLAVYGSHVDPELMRYVVNYQAVRGISLFNFMVISYDRKTPMSLQYRPNFNNCNPSTQRLSQINNYTARLSSLLQKSKAEIMTALYYPARTICAGGIPGKTARESFIALGKQLEAEGISFDIIDEDLVRKSELRNRVLCCENVSYRHVIFPDASLEPKDVIHTLSLMSHTPEPCIHRKNKDLITRKLLLPDGTQGWFLFNQANNTITDMVDLPGAGFLYRLDLFDGSIYNYLFTEDAGYLHVPVNLLRGEGLFLILSDKPMEAQPAPIVTQYCTIEDVTSFVSRAYQLTYDNGIQNFHYSTSPVTCGLQRWDSSFSGEVTYLFNLPELDHGKYILDLGAVYCTAAAYVDGQLIGEATMPPYQIPIDSSLSGKEVQIIVGNTIANVCARSDYFRKHIAADVGPYHERMVQSEALQPGGGLLGPIRLLKKIERNLL